MKTSAIVAICLGLHAAACATDAPTDDGACEPDEQDCGAGADGGGKADGQA